LLPAASYGLSWEFTLSAKFGRSLSRLNFAPLGHNFAFESDNLLPSRDLA